MNRGKLIVIEGLDGSGKETQAKLLKEALAEQGVKIKPVTFPDYNNPSSALVKLYLGGKLGQSPGDVNPYAASSFYAVDRFASYKQFWQKDYEQGKVILADRYATSNAIYQLAKLPKEQWNHFLKWIEEYEYQMLEIPKPDVVLYLDMPPEISQQLMLARYKGDESKKDLHESNFAFLQQCRLSALYASKKLGWKNIVCAENNAPRTIESIHQEVLAITKKQLDMRE